MAAMPANKADHGIRRQCRHWPWHLQREIPSGQRAYSANRDGWNNDLATPGLPAASPPNTGNDFVTKILTIHARVVGAE
jgi:hypothetical protein